MASPTGGFSNSNAANLALAGFSPLVGELPLAKTVLYTVPAGKSTSIASIEVFNGAPGTVQATLYINTNGVDFAFGVPPIATMSSNVDSTARNLPSGTIIKGISDTAGVNYVIQLKEYET